MQDLIGNAAVHPPFETGAAMRADHYDINLVFVNHITDDAGRITAQHRRFAGDAGSLHRAPHGFQRGFRVVKNRVIARRQGGGTWCIRQAIRVRDWGNDRKQVQRCPSCFGQCLGLTQRLLGKG